MRAGAAGRVVLEMAAGVVRAVLAELVALVVLSARVALVVLSARVALFAPPAMVATTVPSAMVATTVDPSPIAPIVDPATFPFPTLLDDSTPAASNSYRLGQRKTAPIALAPELTTVGTNDYRYALQIGQNGSKRIGVETTGGGIRLFVIPSYNINRRIASAKLLCLVVAQKKVLESFIHIRSHHLRWTKLLTSTCR